MDQSILTSSVFPEIELGSDDGLIILVRDRAQEDKLVRVINKDMLNKDILITHLSYDFENNDGRLAYVFEDYPNYRDVGSVEQYYKLYYGDYLNSKGEIDNVLMKVRQVTNLTRKFLNIKSTVMSQERLQWYNTLKFEKAELDAFNLSTRGTST